MWQQESRNSIYRVEFNTFIVSITDHIKIFGNGRTINQLIWTYCYVPHATVIYA